MAKPRQPKSDIPKEVLEEMETARRRASDHTLELLEHWCTEDLAKMELPTTQGRYWLSDDRGVEREGPVGLCKLVKLLGHEDFSDIFFSAWTQTYIETVRRLHDAGEVDAAIQAAIELGSCLADHEKHTHIIWSLGERRLTVRGNAPSATWGSPEERRAKKESLLKLYEEAMSNGAKTQEEAYEIAAKKAGTRARTIRRAVTGY